jgi:tetratricopeptide (TPR) repeat protein
MMDQASSGDRFLVGRARETGSIDQAIEGLSGGRGHIMMIAGEPGIGKSALARYATDSARQQSVPVYWGFAWEAGGAPAYWPWTQLLTSLVEEQEPAPELTTGMHQLLPGVEAAPQAPQLQPQQARFMLLESVRRLLESVSRKTPLVLVLEDLHAADVDSLNLLQYVAGHATHMPVLIIGTFRDMEARAMEASEPLWRTCHDAEVMMLDRLAEADIHEFLKAQGYDGSSDANVRRLLETTEGNPLFLTELVGLLTRHDAGDLPLPASVQQVIRQQIAMLPYETRAILEDASILGREFDPGSLRALNPADPEQQRAALQAAVDAGLLRETSTGNYRYSHVLHRDVLYQGIDRTRRSLLHCRYGEHIRKLIDDGDEDRWTELAEHLNAAGADYRDEAITAWRAAAARALSQLAFEEAVSSLNKAFSAFGEGPRFNPADRFSLLLELASALLLAGDTETGQRYCRDAIDIARTLEDPLLMSEAALTWGSIIVVARIDSELIAALRECLAALPENEVAMRASIQARLAGAMQPAPNPAEPMEMAREAIALARTTNDEHVMYNVLRSAISALMDFAPADERLLLNEEFGALAEKFGDVPGQFRSKLRLMIDACEASNRGAMDRAIDECNHLAERIGLPHYRWRAASARAMQATIDGDFARATRLLDAAQDFADQIDDLEAKISIPLQRFTILIEWDSPAGHSLERIEARLKEAYESGMADAEFFVSPYVNSYKYPPDPTVARRILSNKPIVDRTFAGGDRFSLFRLGEIAAIAGDKALTQRALDLNLPYQDHCATLGLMGTCATGPIAWALGNMAASLGDVDQSLEFFEKALATAESMRAPPWVARIHDSFAAALRAAGHNDVADKHEAEFRRLADSLSLRVPRFAPGTGSVPHPVVKETEAFGMTRDGELWRIGFGGDSAMLRASKGLDMLARLIDQPDMDIHVLDLSGGGPVAEQGDAGPELDRQARAEYESRIADLRDELEEAREFGDTGRADAAQGEIDFITRELSRAFGLGGRERKAGNAAERARVNVRRRLKDAIERVTEQHAEAGRHLENTIKTGTYCRYTPM